MRSVGRVLAPPPRFLVCLVNPPPCTEKVGKRMSAVCVRVFLERSGVWRLGLGERRMTHTHEGACKWAWRKGGIGHRGISVVPKERSARASVCSYIQGAMQKQHRMWCVRSWKESKSKPNRNSSPKPSPAVDRIGEAFFSPSPLRLLCFLFLCPLSSYVCTHSPAPLPHPDLINSRLQRLLGLFGLHQIPVRLHLFGIVLLCMSSFVFSVYVCTCLGVVCQPTSEARGQKESLATYMHTGGGMHIYLHWACSGAYLAVLLLRDGLAHYLDHVLVLQLCAHGVLLCVHNPTMRQGKGVEVQCYLSPASGTLPSTNPLPTNQSHTHTYTHHIHTHTPRAGSRSAGGRTWCSGPCVFPEHFAHVG
jgi:hypothetical protein